MRGLSKTVFVLGVVGVAVMLERLWAEWPGWAPPDAQEQKAEVRLSIKVERAESGDYLQLQVAFENVSENDTTLNLGMMLANGKVHLPEAVRLVLTGADGKARELHFGDHRYPGVAGRIDDYPVPLRAGSVYTLKLSLMDFWCAKEIMYERRLKPGKYCVRAAFRGSGPQHTAKDNLMFLYWWTGVVESEEVEFEVGKGS